VEELQADAVRYSQNFAADGRFCHTYNHTHACKPTCFKNAEYKKPSDTATVDTSAPRRVCRFRFWRLVKVLQRWWRRMGKALVPEPTVAGRHSKTDICPKGGGGIRPTGPPRTWRIGVGYSLKIITYIQIYVNAYSCVQNYRISV
jgi:hypothetical protein